MQFIDHPACNSTFGAPAGTQDSVGALRVVQGTCELGGRPCNVNVSFWQPSAEELALLNAGEPVQLWVFGRSHPRCRRRCRLGRSRRHAWGGMKQLEKRRQGAA